MHAQSFTHDGPAAVYARIDAYNGLFSVALARFVATRRPVNVGERVARAYSLPNGARVGGRVRCARHREHARVTSWLVAFLIAITYAQGASGGAGGRTLNAPFSVPGAKWSDAELPQFIGVQFVAQARCWLLAALRGLSARDLFAGVLAHDLRSPLGFDTIINEG